MFNVINGQEPANNSVDNSELKKKIVNRFEYLFTIYDSRFTKSSFASKLKIPS